MKTNNFFKLNLIAIALVLIITTGCSTDENDFIPSPAYETTGTDLNGGALRTWQDTVNMIKEEFRRRNAPTDYLNEMPKAGTLISGTQTIKVPHPLSAELLEYEAQIIDGEYVVEGDMVFGTEAEYRERLQRAESRGIVTNDKRERWPDGIIPYLIESDHSMEDEIQTAIDKVNSETNLTLRPYSISDLDYVDFIKSDVMSSKVGRQFGRQTIKISTFAKVGNVIHEIFHAAGMIHEQSRCDRNDYVNIYRENIQEDMESNFERVCANGTDMGKYNYGSIMHYGPTFFSKNREFTILPVFERNIDAWLTKALSMGQRSIIADSDRQTIANMYPVKVGQSYVIQAHHSGRGLYASGTKGETIIQTNAGTQGKQLFEFISANNGYYYIKHQTSGLYLSVSYASNRNGAEFILWDFHGNKDQQYKVEYVSDGIFKIQVRHSSKYLDIKAHSFWNNAPLHQWSYVGAKNQHFRIVAR